MKRKTVALFSFIAFTLLCFTTIVQSLPVGAQEAERVIPPTVSSVRPTGLQRGTTKTFTVEVRVGKDWVGQAEGLTKKSAAQQAAREIYEKLKEPIAG